MTFDRNGHPLIALAPTPWRGIWMNRQHLLSRLAARGWPVTYSTGSASVWGRASSEWVKRPAITRTEAADGIRLVTAGRFVADWPKIALTTSIANRVHSAFLRRTAGLNWRTNGILFLFHPSFLPMIDLLQPRHVIFHVFDVYSEMEKWSSDLSCQLDKLCKRADLLTAASEAMGEALPPAGRQKVRILPNGVDIAPFRDGERLPCPDDLAAIPEPRIANVGRLNAKIDFHILAKVARERPDWNLVFVGPVNEGSISQDPYINAAYRELRASPNVHFLGEKDRQEVPSYMSNMDVNLICYLIREGHWASKGYPLKLNEYLASRKPIVATPTDAIRRHFGEVVDIAGTDQEFIDAIDRALRGDGRGSPEARWATAESNTWDDRVDKLDEWLCKLSA